MPFEIERKFLVRRELWNCIHKPEGKFYRQGYIVNDNQKSIRIRIAGDQAWLTIKGATAGAKRTECEYAIPVEHGQQLLESFATGEIIKTRYTVNNDGHIWEVDEFHGAHEGLVIAEVELESEEESFSLPLWVDIEVTHDSRYYNANLTKICHASAYPSVDEPQLQNFLQA